MKKSTVYGICFTALPALIVFDNLFSEYAEFAQWPPSPRLASAAFTAAIAGISGLIGFMNQSLSREQQDGTDDAKKELASTQTAGTKET
jgi:hypothetical protein